SSCAMALRAQLGRLNPELVVVDAIQWAHGLLGSLEIRRRVGRVALHPTCSLRHLGLEDQLRELAAAMADEVVVPAAASCCGMAGDRGLLHPELTASALADEAAELQADGPFDAHLCGNRTCEIALRRATGADYVSRMVLLDGLTRGSPASPSLEPASSTRATASGSSVIGTWPQPRSTSVRASRPGILRGGTRRSNSHHATVTGTVISSAAVKCDPRI